MRKVIRSIFVALCAGFIISFLLGCGFKPMVNGSGVLVSGTVDIDSISEIAVSDTCVLTITQGAVYSMEVESDDNVLEFVKVEQNGESLDVYLNPHYCYNNVTFIVDVSVPDLEAVSLSGASSAYLETCSLSNNLSIDLSGASSLEAPQVECRELDISLSGSSSVIGSFDASVTEMDMSGASDIELTGNTVALTLEGSGASDFYLSEFESINCVVDFSGASYGEIYCSGELDVELSGASTLYYRGNPYLSSVDISGGSSLISMTVK